MTDTERALSWWEDARSRNRRADVVLVRYGDFYETFNADALALAKALKVTLTHKPIHDTPCLLAGLPYYAIGLSEVKAEAAGVKLVIDDSAHRRYAERGYSAYDTEAQP